MTDSPRVIYYGLETDYREIEARLLALYSDKIDVTKGVYCPMCEADVPLSMLNTRSIAGKGESLFILDSLAMVVDKHLTATMLHAECQSLDEPNPKKKEPSYVKLGRSKRHGKW